MQSRFNVCLCINKVKFGYYCYYPLLVILPVGQDARYPAHGPQIFSVLDDERAAVSKAAPDWKCEPHGVAAVRRAASYPGGRTSERMFLSKQYLRYGRLLIQVFFYQFRM